MKVLWLCGNSSNYKRSSNNDGGWIGPLENKVSKNGIELIIAFPYSVNDASLRRDTTIYYPLFTPKWVKFKGVFDRHFRDKYFLKQILYIIDKEKPDIIHCWGSELGFGLIGKYTDIPTILHIQGIVSPYVDAYFPPGYSCCSIFRKLWFKPNIYIPLFRDYVFFKYQSNREKIIYRDIDLFLGRTDWDYKVSKILNKNVQYNYCSEALREGVLNSVKWKYRTDKRLVLSSIMSNAIYKGGDVILKSAKLLKDIYGDNFVWNVIGVDDLYVHEKILDIKSKNVNVSCLGRLKTTELAAKLLNSDIYVHLAYIENSPNSVCEAQYIGVPVVAANVGGVSTLLKDNSGILIPANDVYQTVYNILNIKKDKRLALQLSNNEINVSQKRHDIDEIVKALISIYNSIDYENKEVNR